MSDINALLADPAVKVTDWNSVIGAQNALIDNQNKLRDQQAQKAVGDAYRQALKPDGTIDQPTFNRLVTQNPQAAWQAQKAIQGVGDATGSQAGSNTTQFKLDTSKYEVVNNALTAALAGDDAGLHDRLVQQASRLIDAGVIPREVMLKQLAGLPNDGKQLRQALLTLHTQSLPAEQREAIISKRPVTFDQGTGLQGGTQDPRGGALSTSGPQVPVYAGPGTQGQQVQWKDKEGVQHDTTWAEYNIARGNGQVVGPVTMKPGAGGNVGSAPAGGAGGTQAQPGVPNANNPYRLNPTSPATTAPAPQTKSDTTGPTPGDPEKWKASADQYNADNQAAGSYQQRTFPLAQAAHILNSGDVTTGPGAEAVNRVKEFLATRAATFGWDAQTIQQSKFDELNKYLTQYVNSQGMASGSDARLASAITGNPSAHITTMANKDVVKALIGLERMKQTAITDFRAQGGKPNQYSDYLSDFQTKHDPRAFIADMLTDDQLKKMFAGMSKEQKASYSRTLDLIDRNRGVMGQAAMP